MSRPRPAGASLRVAVLYDFLQTRGGAERFTLDLRHGLPHAELWFHAASEVFDLEELRDVRLLSARPLSARRDARIVRCIYGFLRARKRFRDYDTLLVSGHYAPLACDPDRCDRQRAIYYAHTTPLPFAYGHTPASSGDETPVALSTGVSLLSAWLRPRFEQALRSMDRVLANSAFTAACYRELVGVEADVLYPPCDTRGYTWRPSEGYFLSFARQEPQKRVDRIVSAFLELSHLQLVVASDGSEHDALVKLAAGASNIRFVRVVDPGAIRDLLERCTAVIHVPEREPFGMSVVEALAAGKPVLAANEGGLPEIISEPDCGWLLPADPAPAQIVEAVLAISTADCTARRAACERRAGSFDRTRFIDALSAAIAGRPAPLRAAPSPAHAS